MVHLRPRENEVSFIQIQAIGILSKNVQAGPPILVPHPYNNIMGPLMVEPSAAYLKDA